MVGSEAFRGYVPLKDKQAAIKFKDVPDSELLTYERAETWKGANGVGGVLNSDYVFVDIDDEYQFSKAFQMIRDNNFPVLVRKTSRGGHILARNNGSGALDTCGTGKRLAVGLTADIKTGRTNSYEAIKVDGVEREIVYQSGEIGPMPKVFEPIQTNVDFLTMGDGDGRNEALFTHILTLSRAGFTREETRGVLRTMNEYVLREPLSEDELEVIFRDGAFPDMRKVFFEGRTFRHDKIGQYLIGKLHVVQIDGQIHSYSDGFYMAGTMPLVFEMRNAISTLKNSQINEALSFVKDVVKAVEPSNSKLIGFTNGVLDIESGKLGEFSPEIVITNRIPWKYDPLAYSETVDRALNQWACGDQEIRTLLEEMVGYCLYRRNDFQKMFILTGDRANGKSTFLDFLTFAIGKDNCSALDLSEVGSRFGTAVLAGRLANVGDDIGDDFLDGANVAMIKKIVTGERLTGEFKGRDLFEFVPYAKMIFSANEIPRMKDRTGAMLRRLIIVPFHASFAGSAGNTRLRDELQTPEAAQYLLRLGVDGLKRVLQQGKFTQSAKVQAELDNYEVNNDPIKSFLIDYDQETLFRNSCKDVYLAYRMFCEVNGYKFVSANMLGRYLKRECNIESHPRMVNGKVEKFYREIGAL